MPRKMVGFEKHPIIGYTEAEIQQAKKGSDKDILEIANRISEFVHHSDTHNRKTKAYEVALKNRDTLEEFVCKRLRKLDYKIHSQISQRKTPNWNLDETDLHMGFGEICMHDHPSRTETNFSVMDYIFDKKNMFVNLTELKGNLNDSKKICSISASDFDDLNTDDQNLVKEFLDKENYDLDDINSIEEDNAYDIDGLRIEIGSKEYYIFRDISDIDSKMRDYLENDSEYEYFYTQGIEAKSIDPIHTSYSDWLDLVIQDGWESIVGTYDGSSTDLSGDACYFRRN